MPTTLSTLLRHLSSLSAIPCSRRTMLGGLAVAGFLPLLGGCQNTPLRIAAHSWPGYELLYLARQEGWLAPDQAQLIETGSASQSLQALRKGAAEGAALTLDELLSARASGMPLTAVLVFDVSAGADLVMARPGINSIKQLHGARIGVEQTALGALVLQMTLQAAGINRSQVTVINLPVDQHLAAWQTERLDAAITYEPYAARLQAKGARQIYSSRQMPGMIMDVLAVRTDRLQGRGGQVRAVTAAHFQALQHLQQNPDDASHRMAGRMKLTPEQVRDSFRGLELPTFEANLQYLDGNEPRLLNAARTVSRLMLESGLLKQPDPLTDLFSGRYLSTKEG